MFGLVKRKEFEKLIAEITHNNDEFQKGHNAAIESIQEICPHKVVEEGCRHGLCGYRCKLCRKYFYKIPKGSKVSRMKEVLSDK